MSSQRDSFRRRNRNRLWKEPARRKRHKVQLSFQKLDTRWLMADFTVTNTGDNCGVNPAVGAETGTLPQAISGSNAGGSGNMIAFNISGRGAQTISVLSSLPGITGVARHPPFGCGERQNGQAQCTGTTYVHDELEVELAAYIDVIEM
jgi:hypothetical protein